MKLFRTLSTLGALSLCLLGSSAWAAFDTEDSFNTDVDTTLDGSSNQAGVLLVKDVGNADDSFNESKSNNMATDSNNFSPTDSFNTSDSFNTQNSFNTDTSSHVEDSYNADDSGNYLVLDRSVSVFGSEQVMLQDLVLANPVATATLQGRVSHNYVDLAAAHQSGNNGVSLADCALSDFSGVNNIAVNGGMNSLQQGNIAISVVSVTHP